MLKDSEETDNLFADFPIGATIQDGGKRKRSDGCFSLVFFGHILLYHPKNKRKREIKLKKIDKNKIKSK